MVSFCPFKVQGTKGQTSVHTLVRFFVCGMIGRFRDKEIIMKKCLFALLLISTSLGQDILITQAGTKYDGKMLEVRHDKIEFQAEGMISAQTIPMKTIESLVLSDGTEVVINGYLVKSDLIKEPESALVKSDNFEDELSLNLSNVGGILIGVSGILMYSNNQRTLKENPSPKEQTDFYDKTKSNLDLSYILLTLGGALIAIDNLL